MKQRFFWFIVCGMFFCLLGFLFAGIGIYALKFSFPNYGSDLPTLFAFLMCVIMEFIGATHIFLGIAFIPKEAS